MKYLFFLNGAYEDIANAEVCSLLKAYDYTFTATYGAQQTLLLDVCGKVENCVFSRLALSHRVMEYLGSIEPGSGRLPYSAIEDTFENVSLRVRVKKIDKDIVAMDEERRIAQDILSCSPGAKVDLGHPDKDVYGLYVDGMVHCGITVFLNDANNFNKRKPQHRPYFHPSSIDPRLARALINLAGAKKEILDPFCGTGGILIEAGLMGLSVTGIDIEGKMVEGTRRNLEHYGIDGTVIHGDATHISEYVAHSETIVTDVPYGKSTVVNGARDELYARAFREMGNVASGHIVVVVPAEIEFSRFGLSIEQSFSIRVHKSLVRHIYVLIPRRF